MAYLTIDGTDIDVLQDSGTEEFVEVGDSGRAFDGTFLQRIDALKREWSLKTLLTVEEWNTLRTTIMYPGAKSVTGTIVDDVETDCYLIVEKAEPIPDDLTVRWIIHFKLIEA